MLLELIGDLLPAGVVNVVNGSGGQIGKHLATSPKIAKVAFTGSTAVGRQIMQFATENIIPCTLELGGKSPNIFFPDIYDHEDAFLDKAIEGLVLFALNQGQVCTCPSRALIHEKIYDKFMQKVLKRVEAIKVGNPLELDTMMGAQVDENQVHTILNYMQVAKEEGAECLIGGDKKHIKGLENGCYVQPTIYKGHNQMRIFQEEIFGPVLAVTTFKDEQEALEIANDTIFGLGAAVWTRDINLAYRVGRAIKAGRVWTNCYHLYPAHAAFGGYKQSGIGREGHKMMLEHYQQTKNLLVSYSPHKLGFF
ncbi:Aldehyde dehydrogenase [Helicobacter heilmannii ASB1.4]|nr:aldehyde dehydrogenase family protein [Helicobacter heilmannii]CCM11278.2 Aldehyde dehydrogenase [Helicobacter heilmannii ASB1.4]